MADENTKIDEKKEEDNSRNKKAWIGIIIIGVVIVFVALLLTVLIVPEFRSLGDLFDFIGKQF